VCDRTDYGFLFVSMLWIHRPGYGMEGPGDRRRIGVFEFLVEHLTDVFLAILHISLASVFCTANSDLLLLS
jgi:hypothetical protein